MNFIRISVAILITLFIALPVYCGQSTDNIYRQPSQTIVDIVNTPYTPSVHISPDRNWFLLIHYPNLPHISELAERELKLAGYRFKPDVNAPSRGFYSNGFSILNVKNNKTVSVAGLPENPRLGGISWAPDSKHIVFVNVSEGGTELWVLDVAKAEAKKLLSPIVNYSTQIKPKWFDSGKSVICCTVSEGRKKEPEKSSVPKGPVIQESFGKAAPARTYQDLLSNSYDEKLFDYYLTSQLVKVSLDGDIKKLGKPAIIDDVDTSPDGNYILVESIHKPYSYLVPSYRFPRLIEVWDKEGNSVFTLTDRPLQENIPIARGSVTTGPRNASWRNDKPATLYWTEALDGGDAGKEANWRDEIFMLPAPFDGSPKSLIKLKLRSGGVIWGSDDLAIVSEWWWKTRKIKSWRVCPGNISVVPELLLDHSWEDKYNDPGEPETYRNEWGRSVLLVAPDGNSIYMSGKGASPEGNRPFLDCWNLNTKEKKRLFHSKAPYYEEPVTLLDSKGQKMITRRESVEEPPNYFLRELKGNKLSSLTAFPHPSPQLKGIEKEIIQYKRQDGVALSGTLYLPKGYKKEDGPLPMFMTAYPKEFKSAKAAGQLDDSPYRFDRVGWWSPLLWLLDGYAVLDGPAMPIIGEGDNEPNDTFVEQLVMDAEAAVNAVVEKGVVKKDKIIISGHSYGAFMTANLLAHSELFVAGIAKSGAYNRTLTPFGFQSEERTLWEAPEVYFKMSPFMNADKINEPLLLIHGEDDPNPGTFPIQSERLYNAIKGLGGTARYVLLPLEGHGYRARESVLHVLWEMERWLEEYFSEETSLEENE